MMDVQQMVEVAALPKPSRLIFRSEPHYRFHSRLALISDKEDKRISF